MKPTPTQTSKPLQQRFSDEASKGMKLHQVRMCFFIEFALIVQQDQVVCRRT